MFATRRFGWRMVSSPASLRLMVRVARVDTPAVAEQGGRSEQAGVGKEEGRRTRFSSEQAIGHNRNVTLCINAFHNPATKTSAAGCIACSPVSNAVRISFTREGVAIVPRRRSGDEQVVAKIVENNLVILVKAEHVAVLSRGGVAIPQAYNRG